MPLPYLDEVVIRVITDEPVKVINLMSGDIDITDYLNAATSLDTLKNNKNIEVIRTTAGDHFALYPNHLYGPLGDPRVRIAITHAIDKQAISDALTRGYGRVAPFPVAAGQWFYDDYDPYQYDPQRAKELLAEAGYPNGFSIKLQNIAREPDNTIVQAIQGQLKNVGINAEIESLERNAWVALFQRNSAEATLAFGRWTFPGLMRICRSTTTLAKLRLAITPTTIIRDSPNCWRKRRACTMLHNGKALFKEIQSSS